MPATAKTKTQSKRTSNSPKHPAVEFINRLTHTGDFSGEPFCLRQWQEDDFIRGIFGQDGRPRYRRVFGALPRKQGKTELVAAILLYLMLGTGKRDQRIYSASGDREQAALIYSAAAAMIANSEYLSSVCHVYKSRKEIEVARLGSTYKALSSEAFSKHGLRPSAVLFDELHVMPNRDLFNSLMTAFGATINPLTIMITTAGYDRTSLCWEQWSYARGVRDGLIEDPTFLPIIYEADPADDWREEATWRKAMPALGDFCQLEFIRDECKRAQQIPAYENTFRQLYLNQWTEQAQRWLSVEAWKACGSRFNPDELIGHSCYAGFDGAVTGDMACFWMVFPTDKGVRTIGHGWVPRDGKWRDEPRNRDRYRLWNQQGFLTFTDGNTIDRRKIRADIGTFNQKYPITQMLADRAYSMDLLNDLFNEEGMNVKGIAQGPLSLNEACVRLEELVLSGAIEHGSNPILDWNISNASLKRGTTGLVYPDRSSATERIDGLMALVYALAAYVSDPESYGPSVYEKRGMFFV
jgi:phage terminase large subunit-like protein